MNSLELVERKFQKGKDGQDIPASYYPVTSMIGVRDKEKSMTVLTDRAMGGSSIKSGRVEVMINRKTVTKDLGGIQREFDMDGVVTAEMHLFLDE